MTAPPRLSGTAESALSADKRRLVRELLAALAQRPVWALPLLAARVSPAAAADGEALKRVACVFRNGAPANRPQSPSSFARSQAGTEKTTAVNCLQQSSTQSSSHAQVRQGTVRLVVRRPMTWNVLTVWLHRTARNPLLSIGCRDMQPPMHACTLASCANAPCELQCRAVEGAVGVPRLRPTPGPSGAAVASPGVPSAYCLVRPGVLPW